MNSTSFGEYLYAGGFIQKTAKADLIVKGNDGISPNKSISNDELECTIAKSSSR